MLAMREALRHLESGGAVLLFARGTIDPDPAFMAGGESELNGWSRSLEIFLGSVPESTGGHQHREPCDRSGLHASSAHVAPASTRRIDSDWR